MRYDCLRHILYARMARDGSGDEDGSFSVLVKEEVSAPTAGTVGILGLFCYHLLQKEPVEDNDAPLLTAFAEFLS